MKIEVAPFLFLIYISGAMPKGEIYMASEIKIKVVLKYRSAKGRLISKSFKTFKAAYDFAVGKGMSEFEINSIRYFNL